MLPPVCTTAGLCVTARDYLKARATVVDPLPFVARGFYWAIPKELTVQLASELVNRVHRLPGAAVCLGCAGIRIGDLDAQSEQCLANLLQLLAGIPVLVKRKLGLAILPPEENSYTLLTALIKWRITFDMSGTRQRAKPAVGCPLVGRVRHRCSRWQFG